MHLFRKTFFIVGAIVSTLACHDFAAPPAPPTTYALDNINGRPLPTYFSPVPEAPTIISAILELDATGGAKLTEHRNQMAGGDVTNTSSYVYTISGNAIQFEYRHPCPINANCVAPPKGTISGSRLLLEMYGS